MVIGKSKVTEMNRARVTLEKTATGDELAVCRFNGKQRDAYMATMLEMKRLFDPTGKQELKVESMTAEQVKLFTDMEYLLVQLTVMDAEAWAEGRMEPLFEQPTDVATQVEPAVLSDWVKICNRVNGLGDAEERKIAADFTTTRSGASGSGSPACVEGSTSPV